MKHAAITTIFLSSLLIACSDGVIVANPDTLDNVAADNTTQTTPAPQDTTPVTDTRALDGLWHVVFQDGQDYPPNTSYVFLEDASLNSFRATYYFTDQVDNCMNTDGALDYVRLEGDEFAETSTGFRYTYYLGDDSFVEEIGDAENTDPTIYERITNISVQDLQLCEI